MSPETQTAIVGYERVPDGKACKFCSLAAGQRYKGANLLPIHSGCGCGVEPITEAHLFKPKVGERAEIRHGNELAGKEWKPVVEVARGKVVKKGGGQYMLNAGTTAKPRWVTTDALNIRKPSRAKAAVTGPDTIDLDTLPAVEPTLKGQALRDRMVQPKGGFGAAERAALRDYTGGKGDVAERMNRSLRKGTFGPRSRDVHVRDGIDRAFDKVDPLDEPGLVYRGAKVKFARKLKPGSVIEDQGFVSTSPSRSVADKFAGFDADIFEIVLPKGTRALDINEAAGSVYGSEREVLLPRGSRFVIESIRPDPKKPGRRIIRVRLMV